jgi:hypothetical protein
MKMMKNSWKKSKRRDIPCSWIGRNVVKMSILSKTIYNQCSPHLNINVILHITRKNNLEILMELQKTPNSQSLEVGIKLEILHYQITTNYTTKIKQNDIWHKNRHTDQCRKDRDKKSPHTFTANSFLTKESRTHNGERKISLVKWCWENWIATCKMKLDPYLWPVININSKPISGLHVRAKTMKLQEENLGEII